MEQKPKSITKNFTFRNRKIGKNRRVMMTEATLDKTPHFPKPVGYSDIDQAVFDWCNNEIEITYQGYKFPTYKLFSNQRLSEYAQNWSSIDEKGNLNLNFKTITRESNPQKGELTGNNYNIPGNRDYVVFKTFEVEDDGEEIVQTYSMKQPFSVNLTYTMNVITSSYSMLNEANAMILDKFKSLEEYIFPNGHAMPMELNSISDESDYTIEDRKYYSQSYQFKVMAYIINEKDFKVTKMRSRLMNQFIVGENSGNKKKKEKFNIGTFTDNTNILVEKPVESNTCSEVVPVEIEIKENPNIDEAIYGESNIEIEESTGLQKCFCDTEYEIEVERKVTYIIDFDLYKNRIVFEADSKLEVETLFVENLRSYDFWINGIQIRIDDSDVVFDVGDKVEIEGILNNPRAKGKLKIVCYDPDTVVGENETINL